MDHNVTVPAAPAIPDEILFLFGRPPLLPNEDHDVYSALLARTAAAVRPKDAIEWMWVLDFVDLTSEIARLRRAKTAIINVTRKEALRTVLESILAEEEIEEGRTRMEHAIILTEGWFANAETRDKVRTLMRRHDIHVELTMTAQAIALRSRELDVIERSIASAQARRNAALEQMDLRRAMARRLQREAEIINAEETETVPLRLENRAAEGSPV